MTQELSLNQQSAQAREYLRQATNKVLNLRPVLEEGDTFREMVLNLTANQNQMVEAIDKLAEAIRIVDNLVAHEREVRMARKPRFR